MMQFYLYFEFNISRRRWKNNQLKDEWDSTARLNVLLRSLSSINKMKCSCRMCCRVWCVCRPLQSGVWTLWGQRETCTWNKVNKPIPSEPFRNGFKSFHLVNWSILRLLCETNRAWCWKLIPAEPTEIGNEAKLWASVGGRICPGRVNRVKVASRTPSGLNSSQALICLFRLIQGKWAYSSATSGPQRYVTNANGSQHAFPMML